MEDLRHAQITTLQTTTQRERVQEKAGYGIRGIRAEKQTHKGGLCLFVDESGMKYRGITPGKKLDMI